MKMIRIALGHLIRHLGLKIQGPFWACNMCGHIEFKEREVGCWHCPTGEMIYQPKWLTFDKVFTLKSGGSTNSATAK